MKRKILCESNHHIDDPEAESPVLQQQCEAGAWQWQRSPYMCPQSLSSPLSTVQCVHSPVSLCQWRPLWPGLPPAGQRGGMARVRLDSAGSAAAAALVAELLSSSQCAAEPSPVLYRPGSLPWWRGWWQCCSAVWRPVTNSSPVHCSAGST